jgi:hypothetical protein
VSTSDPKAVAGMFASRSAHPEETPLSPSLDVQKRLQTELLKEKMKELHLDVEEDAITRETEAQERLVRRSVEENKKQKENSNEEMEGAENSYMQRAREKGAKDTLSQDLSEEKEKPNNTDIEDDNVEKQQDLQDQHPPELPKDFELNARNTSLLGEDTDKAGAGSEETPVEPPADLGLFRQLSDSLLKSAKKRVREKGAKVKPSQQEAVEGSKSGDHGIRRSSDEVKQQDEQGAKPSDDSKDDRIFGKKVTDVREDDPTKYDTDRFEKVFREIAEDLESTLGAPLRLSEHVKRGEEERLEAEQLKATTMSEPVEQNGGLATDVGETYTEGEADKNPDNSGKKTQGARELIWGLGSKAVAGMFASNSSLPEVTLLMSPSLDVQKRRQTDLLKEKMKELHLDVDEDAINRENQTQEKLVQESVEQKIKQNEKCKEEMEGAEGTEESTSGSKAVAGMFASRSAQPEETPLSPSLDVQKRLQTELLKEKMKELHLDVDKDAITRETEAQERLVRRSVLEENKKQKENSNEEMEGAEDTDESKTNEEAQLRRNNIINLTGSVGLLLPSWKEPSSGDDDEALEEASPQQSGESTDMPTVESPDGNEKPKVDTVSDKEGKQAATGETTSGLFGFFAGSSNQTKQQKPTVEKESDAQIKEVDQLDQKVQSHSKEPQEIKSGRQSEDNKGAQKTADGGRLLSFFLGPKGEKKETKDQAEETPDPTAEDNAREDGTPGQTEKGSESGENLTNGETEYAVASGDDEALEEASPQQSGESTDMPTVESPDGNEKPKVDTVSDKEGKQAATGKPTSGLFGFFAGSSNQTKQQKPTVEKESDAQIKEADQLDQKVQSHSKEPQEIKSGRQSEDNKGAQKTADGGRLLSFFLGPKGEKKETKDQAEETPDPAAEDNAREDGTPGQTEEKGSESGENLTNGETEYAVASGDDEALEEASPPARLSARPLPA